MGLFSKIGNYIDKAVEFVGMVSGLEILEDVGINIQVFLYFREHITACRGTVFAGKQNGRVCFPALIIRFEFVILREANAGQKNLRFAFFRNFSSVLRSDRRG